MQYVIWQVFEEKKTTFFIVNKVTHKIQSVWKNYIEAKVTCDKLNVWVVKEAI